MKLNFYKSITTAFMLGSLLMGATKASAQAYTFSPGKKSTTTINTNSSTDYLISVKNNSSSSLDLYWKILPNTLPSSWSYTICDWETCYPSSSTKFDKMPRSIAGGETVTFKFTVDVADTAGSGMTRLLVYPAGQMANADTIQVTFNAQAVTGISERSASAANMTLSPNPATDYIDVMLTGFNTTTSLNKIDVFNILGNKVLSATPERDAMTKINVSELPAGLYFIKYAAKGGNTVTKKFNKIN